VELHRAGQRRLTRRCNFNYDDIRLLTERRATRVEILKRLDWLVKGLKPGDRIVFLYSGHGNRLATRSVEGHVDKYYECICPYDFDWDGKNTISDRELCDLFSRIPAGARLTWISDSCYSGGLPELEGVPARRAGPRGKTIELPADIAWRIKTAIDKKIQPLKMSGVVEHNDVILISATRERQQAQEKGFKKEIKLNGLLVYFLLEELHREGGLSTPLKAVMENVGRKVKHYGRTSRPHFDQEPMLYGRPELLGKAFLK
jgi:metacaspase-1